ncbi:hypothetical protein BC629DRAFT_1492937 [Irpex lacteus]|nr:hypothetical protein BC629DRAFT_1492937 [Irpex lacteus]
MLHPPASQAPQIQDCRFPHSPFLTYSDSNISSVCHPHVLPPSRRPLAHPASCLVRNVGTSHTHTPALLHIVTRTYRHQRHCTVSNQFPLHHNELHLAGLEVHDSFKPTVPNSTLPTPSSNRGHLDIPDKIPIRCPARQNHSTLNSAVLVLLMTTPYVPNHLSSHRYFFCDRRHVCFAHRINPGRHNTSHKRSLLVASLSQLTAFDEPNRLGLSPIFPDASKTDLRVRHQTCERIHDRHPTIISMYDKIL